MSDLLFHDAHAHSVCLQRGGFLIALEGASRPEGTLDNAGVLAKEDRGRMLFGVPYASAGAVDSGVAGPVIKYHARREGYSPEWVANDLSRFQRRLALVDTLNSLDWPTEAYCELAGALPPTQFLFCHAGGYDLLEFIKMCRFISNVWLDFSATQHIVGWAQSTGKLTFADQLIEHSFEEPRICERVLFGSDTPWFDQRDAVERVLERAPDPSAILIDNFERLVAKVGLV